MPTRATELQVPAAQPRGRGTRAPLRTLLTATLVLCQSTCNSLRADFDEPPHTLPSGLARGAVAGIGRSLRTQLAVRRYKHDAMATTACPSGMLAVVGSYCPKVEHTCLRWLDPPGRYHRFRCAEYARNPRCLADREPMRFCIDELEQGATATDARPAQHVSFLAAQAACEARGARLCTHRQWQFACEGEQMHPYPYGFERDAHACNIDRTDLGFPGAGLRDHRTTPAEHPACRSPFGVRDLAGNLEEWVEGDEAGDHRTLLKGSWWMPGRSTCRAANAGHDARYEGPETGYRCCADLR